MDTLSSAPANTTGTVTIQCGAFLGLLSSISMTVSLGEGRGGASTASRFMTSSTTATTLTYQLYRDSGRTQVWGSSYWANGGAPVELSKAQLLDTGGTFQLQIYGRVAGGQNAAVPGSYASVFSLNPTDVRVDYRTCTLILLCTNRTATFPFTVQAAVSPNCLVTASDLAFGSVGLLDVNHDAASGISVTCTPLSSYSIGLGNGLHSATTVDRRMQSGAGLQIGYGLFRNAGRTLAWGSLASGTSQPAAGSGGVQQFAVYGRVPPQATPPAGVYSDSIVVTITY